MTHDMIVTLKDILKKREINVEYVFDAKTLVKIVKEFDLQDINSLKANFKLVPTANHKGIAVYGTLKGLVIHHCVVTLGPVPQSINEQIAVRYTPNGEDDILNELSDAAIAKINLHQDYDIEILVNEQIDLYDIVREYLSLSLLSTPRVANARFDGFTIGNLSPQEKKQLNKNLDLISDGKQPLSNDNPFASLAALKQKIEDC
jgi:uncharacterized metal-binding protein YceD (DUF177 family)